MAPKKKFTKEQIIEAAFFIAKTDGLDEITIRKVSDLLGSSSAPVYLNFQNFEDLKLAVIQKIVTLSQQKIAEQNTGTLFADIGVASLKMAMEYPVLTRDLVLQPNEYIKEFNQKIEGMLLSLMRQDDNLAGFTESELGMILLKMKVFQSGLTMMVTNGLLPSDFTLEQMMELSHSVAEDVVMATRLRQSKAE